MKSPILITSDALASVHPDWNIVTAPLADGGDGFCETLVHLANGTFQNVDVSGPLGHPTRATYGLVDVSNICGAAQERLSLPSGAKTLAIVELAQSSGIALVPLAQRSPWTTSTFGLGQVIRHAAENGANAILVGLGGSSSNDLGLGVLQAVGFTFKDAMDKPIESRPTPENWRHIASIAEPSTAMPIPVLIACDVETPLLGPNGAAAIFGKQKGLLPEDLAALEAQSHTMADKLCEACGHNAGTSNTSGSGAAGGTAFGLMVGLGGRILPGAALVFAWANLDEALAQADTVLTGEGRFDNSSLQGKGPGALAVQASQAGKAVYVFAGSLGTFENGACSNLSLAAISPEGMPIEEALANTETNLRNTIQAAFT